MSITGALSHAYSGLVATSRAAELVSNNVANALTEGYARQDVALTSAALNGVGAGVRVTGVVRAENPVATSNRRRAEADLANRSATADAMARLAVALGQPGEAGSLAARFVAFETALKAAAETPESAALQAEVVSAALGVTTKLNQVSTENSRIRMDADATIQRQVTQVNGSLKKLESINREITLRAISGVDVAALEDERQRLIDDISRIIPIKAVARENNQVAIISQGGAILLDGRAGELGFTPTATITPDMTLGSGTLSGLTLNGKPMAIGGAGAGLLDGGSLSAQFAIRDEIAPGFDAQIDALARDLLSRLQDPAVDATLAPGDPGFFTDGGAAFDPMDEIGLAGRIRVNAAVDPAQGGALWRVRDGVNAPTPGETGTSALLHNMADALTRAQTPLAGLSVAASGGASAFASGVSALRAQDAALAEYEAAYQTGRAAQFRAAELDITGVDTDREMQHLLLLERSYAANARVIEAADGMLRRLLEI